MYSVARSTAALHFLEVVAGADIALECVERRHGRRQYDTNQHQSTHHSVHTYNVLFVTRLQPTAPFVPLTLCPRRKTKSKISSRILFRTGEVLQNEGNTTAVAFSAKSV